MMASAPAYTAYAEQVLMPAVDPGVLAEIKALEAAGDIENPRYMELLMPHYYEHHTLRMPSASWPDPVVRGFAHINPKIYVPMQGPSELGMSADAKLATWDRFADLSMIEVPTLVIGARYDTMDPDHMAEMARHAACPAAASCTAPAAATRHARRPGNLLLAGFRVAFLSDLPPAAEGP